MKSLKKRQLTVLIAFALAFVLLAACAKGNGSDGGCLFGYGYSDFNDEHYRYDDVYENAFISTREQTSSNFFARQEHRLLRLCPPRNKCRA